MMSRPSLILIALATMSSASFATVIVTNDGQRYDGEVTRTETGWSVALPDGSVKAIDSGSVKTIEASRDRAEMSRAAEGLDSLRRSVEFSNDLNKIIERYDGFVAQTTDPIVRDNAQKDLALWQQRRQDGLIKVGKAWVTTAQSEQIAKDNFQAANDARAAMKAGQTADAQQVVSKLLDQDPENISALYLLGVIQAKQANWFDARKTFTHLQQTIPTHSPTSYDLAVVLARQNQWGPACGAMEQALTSTPDIRLLLDSTAELLHMIPPERRNLPAAQRLAKLFLAQDAILQKEMVKQKLYRWGSNWVDESTHDQQKLTIDTLDQKVKDLQTQFDKAQDRTKTIDGQVLDNQTAIRQIEQHSYVVMPDGTVVRTPYPSAYYDLKNQIAQLRNERSDLATQVDTLQTTARETRAKYPVPTYTGVINLVEEDGVPFVGPMPVQPPATQPVDAPPAATAPSGPIIRIGPANANP